jgi:hypothetical protein
MMPVLVSFCRRALIVVAALTAAMLPATAQPVPLPVDAGNVVQCGFLKVTDLPVKRPSIKCETTKRVHSNGGDVEVVTLSMRLDPRDSYLLLFAEKDMTGYGWRPISSDDVLASAKQWSKSLSPKNMGGVNAGPFRHVKFNVYDRADFACGRGNAVGNKPARSGGEAKHHIWISFCERGDHAVLDENLGKVYSAITMD